MNGFASNISANRDRLGRDADDDMQSFLGLDGYIAHGGDSGYDSDESSGVTGTLVNPTVNPPLYLSANIGIQHIAEVLMARAPKDPDNAKNHSRRLRDVTNSASPSDIQSPFKKKIRQNDGDQSMGRPSIVGQSIRDRRHGDHDRARQIMNDIINLSKEALAYEKVRDYKKAVHSYRKVIMVAQEMPSGYFEISTSRYLSSSKRNIECLEEFIDDQESTKGPKARSGSHRRRDDDVLAQLPKLPGDPILRNRQLESPETKSRTSDVTLFSSKHKE